MTYCRNLNPEEIIVLRTNYVMCKCLVDRDSSVGIAIRYGLDGPGIESRWGCEISLTRPDRPCGLPSRLYIGYRVSAPWDKSALGWALTTHHYVEPGIKKE